MTEVNEAVELSKTYCVRNGRTWIEIRPMNCYAESMETLLQMYDLARWDFPEVQLEDIHIVKFLGRTIKGFMGIHFPVSTPFTDGYTQVKEFEPCM